MREVLIIITGGEKCSYEVIVPQYACMKNFYLNWQLVFMKINGVTRLSFANFAVILCAPKSSKVKVGFGGTILRPRPVVDTDFFWTSSCLKKLVAPALRALAEGT